MKFLANTFLTVYLALGTPLAEMAKNQQQQWYWRQPEEEVSSDCGTWTVSTK